VFTAGSRNPGGDTFALGTSRLPASAAEKPKAGGMQIKNECTIEIEGEERPALVAETITVLYG